MRIFLRFARSFVCLILCVSINSCQTTKVQQGTLVVSMLPMARGFEGYVTFFLVNSSGSRVEEARLKPGASDSVSLSPDSHYELVSYIRDCSENLKTGLSTPADECRAPFTLKAGETLYAKRPPLADMQNKPRCELIFSPASIP